MLRPVVYGNIVMLEIGTDNCPGFIGAVVIIEIKVLHPDHPVKLKPLPEVRTLVFHHRADGQIVFHEYKNYKIFIACQ
jgi:hypothetical protein